MVPFWRRRDSICNCNAAVARRVTLHSDGWHGSDNPVTSDKICIFLIIKWTIRKENKHILVVPMGVARAMSDISTVQIKADRAQLTRYTCRPHHRPYLSDSRAQHIKPHMHNMKVQNLYMKAQRVKFFIVSLSTLYKK